MVFPLNANKIEQLDIDPVRKINGYIWFNKIEKVYKTYVDDQVQIFLTDRSFEGEGAGIIDLAISTHHFTVSFTDTFKIIIKHNKGNLQFIYNVYDTEEKVNLPCSLEILNDNEISIDFVDAVTGSIFMYFE